MLKCLHSKRNCKRRRKNTVEFSERESSQESASDESGKRLSKSKKSEAKESLSRSDDNKNDEEHNGIQSEANLSRRKDIQESLSENKNIKESENENNKEIKLEESAKEAIEIKCENSAAELTYSSIKLFTTTTNCFSRNTDDCMVNYKTDKVAFTKKENISSNNKINNNTSLTSDQRKVEQLRANFNNTDKFPELLDKFNRHSIEDINFPSNNISTTPQINETKVDYFNFNEMVQAITEIMNGMHFRSLYVAGKKRKSENKEVQDPEFYRKSNNKRARYDTMLVQNPSVQKKRQVM